MNVNQERIAKLQQEMKAAGIDLYLVPTADFHQSEYVGDYFKARAWLSGFTGSAGTLIVTQDQACLWTDGRYFIQAAKQLSDVFAGKGEADVLRAIYREAEKGRKAGTLQDSDLDNFFAAVAPMLDAPKRKKLEQVIAKLKKM